MFDGDIVDRPARDPSRGALRPEVATGRDVEVAAEHSALIRRVPAGLNFVRLRPGYTGGAEQFSLRELCRARPNEIQRTWHLLQGFTLCPAGLAPTYDVGTSTVPFMNVGRRFTMS